MIGRGEIGDKSARCRIEIKPAGVDLARVDGSALAGQCLKAPRAQRAKLDEALPGSQRPDHGIQWAPTSIGRAAVLARREADTHTLRRQPRAGNCQTPGAPIRRCAKRRRIKTVLQAVIYRAGRIIDTGSRLILALAANDRGARVFSRLGPNGRTDIDCRTQRRRRHGPEGANRLTQHAQGIFDAPRRCTAHQATTEVRPQGHVRG